ncbi:MAG TPA: ABC transporter permease subunit [Anaerolineales bacterium]|nr:ABC transporter permease subunit [Anaerolineales bacterium]
MDKIKTIILKEWAEVFKNRFVLFTVAFLPLIMTAIPIAILVTLRGEAGLESVSSEMPAQFTAFCPADLSGGECFQVYLVSQFMIMFMIVPLAIPATISSYSIVGEKTTHSLEPLLATPITTAELLVGKSLAAAIPAVLATWLGFAVFAAGAWILIPNKALFAAILDLRWLLAIFLVGPLMAIMAVNLSVMVSSRVNDPRVAEQISMVVILPVLVAFFGQLAGLFLINRQLILATGGVLIVLDMIMVYLAVRLFQRETILTRWK